MYVGRKHGQELTRHALKNMDVEVYGPKERESIISFNVGGMDPHEVATVMDEHGIAIRSGHHCAQPLHERLGESATGRASFSVYSSTDDIDRLAAGLRGVQRIFGRAPATAGA